MTKDESPSPRKTEQSNESDLDSLSWGEFEDWIQLVRFPAVFTLLSNVAVTAILANLDLLPITAFIPTLLASVAAYWAGMILNDVVDLEEDRQNRSRRPLAAGKISPVVAGHVATALLMVCPLLILGTTLLHNAQPLWLGAAFASSVALVICVRGYNSILKSTLLGPFLMGGCRALNILMVGCALFSVGTAERFPIPLLYFAAATGIYILGVTIFAGREEHEDSDSAQLLLGLALQVGGLALVAFLPRGEYRELAWTLNPNAGYPLLMGLIAMTVIHRSLKAILQPSSRLVQLAVKHSLLTLILIDAGVVVTWAGPYYGCAVVALLIPALASAMKVRTT
ncbi:MAG: UbiA family prenyltransferase [Planctomycetota bacterium]